MFSGPITSVTQEMFDYFFAPQLANNKTLLLYSVSTVDLNLPTKLSSQSKVFDTATNTLDDLTAILSGYEYLESTPVLTIFVRHI